MSARHEIDLSGEGWRLWRDERAEWQDDKLHLPPVDVGTLPARLPTGGWQALGASGLDVSVPGTVEQHYWNDVGDYRGVSWWWRSLALPPETVDRRAILRFEAARLRAEVFFNGQLVGYDVIGNTPFEIDVSHRIPAGAENQLAVRVTDPCGNLSWEDFIADRWGRYTLPASHGFGGITGPVRLLLTDPVYVGDVFVKNKPAITEVDVDITIRNTTDSPTRQDVRLQIVEANDAASVVFEQMLPDVELPPGDHVVSVSAAVPDAKVWDLDHPNLYRCRVSLAAGDTCDTRFGFRWFAPEGVGERAMFRLNGRRIVLRSAISWGFWPGSGMIPTPELIDKQVQTAKAMGLNTLNFHRCIGTPAVLDRADELGLLCYEEPGGFDCREGDEFCFAWAREKLLRMVRRDRNHPSLIIYNMINEEQWPPRHRHERDIADAHALDPTRTITYTSGWNQEGDDPTKLHMRPYDDQLHIRGWYDWHNAGGPGVYCDEFYQGPEEYRQRTTNNQEIVFWGEEGAIGTPPRLGQIEEALRGQPDGWDGADYRAWHKAYREAFEGKGWGCVFSTIDNLTGSCGNIAYAYQGRTIENIRIGNCTDGYVVNGWEAEKHENHSGIVDCFRNAKGDPAILAQYNRPLYVAVKLRQKVGHPPATVLADFHIVNEMNVHGSLLLRVWLENEAGERLWESEHPVTVTGGETFGELLVEGVAVEIAAGPGRYFVRAALQDGEREIATGVDDVFLVDWRSQGLPAAGAHLGEGAVAREFLQTHKSVDLPAFSGQQGTLAYILAEGYDPLPQEVIPSACLRPKEGRLCGLTGEFYRGVQFDNLLFARTDPTIDFEWKEGPDPAVGRENYSVRWQGTLRPPESGAYRFHLTHDDGARLWVDGELLIDEWSVFETWAVSRPLTQASRAVQLEEGHEVDIRLEFFQQPGRGLVRLLWTTPTLAAQQSGVVGDVLRRVHDGGTTLIALDHGEGWAYRLEEAGLCRYRGRLQGGLYWLGSNFFVRAHPLFADLPANQAMNWEYQALARYEADRYGLLLDGEEAVVGFVSGHHHAVATAVAVLPHGKGRIIVSTLDLCRVLNEPAGPADIARKILCNYLAVADGGGDSASVR